MDAKIEWLKSSEDIEYFVDTYVEIYNATISQWIPFGLWPAQRQALTTLRDSKKVIILKARQLGMSWLSLAYALWLFVFHPPATVLLFSRTLVEAKELLARLIDMYKRLPAWMQARTIVLENKTEFEISTGSRALAFTSKGGRSFTGTLLIADEFDFIEEQNEFIKATKPTIDAGAQMFYISTSDKKRPITVFKNLFRAAIKGAGEYIPVFIPWHARPGRSQEWYERIKIEMFSQRHTNDDLYAEYPSTAEEALAPEELDRRIPFDWLQKIYQPVDPANELLPAVANLAIPGLSLFLRPEIGHHYVIGVDPAEGNPRSDDSAATVLDAKTWEEVASIAGKIEPTIFADHVHTIAAHYNNAGVLVERNNHGHTVIARLNENGTYLLKGDDGKHGFPTTAKSKPHAYNRTADAIRNQLVLIHTAETASQLASIQASNLSAPQGLHDDRAMSYVLSIVAAAAGVGAAPSSAAAPADPLTEYDKGRF